MVESMDALWPEDTARLRRRFEEKEFYPEEIPRGEQATLLLALLGLYADKGLAPATRPLCACCPHSGSCWRSASRARRTPTRAAPEDGGIILPWVGDGYRPGGLLIIAVNPNIAETDATHLLSEHEITWDRHHRTLENGQRLDEGSNFAYRMARSAALLLDSVDGRELADHEEPQDLVGSLHRTARLQSVKCVPRRKRSRPTSAMQRICPNFLLEQELAILRPGAILTLGNIPDSAVAQLSGYEDLETESSEFLWRHTLTANWGRAEIFSIPHPADPHNGWVSGHDELLEHLQRDRARMPSRSTRSKPQNDGPRQAAEPSGLADATS